jgi:catechol 2,3-dioxygenase-like lactoylglutathione lyase family enzyme
MRTYRLSTKPSKLARFSLAGFFLFCAILQASSAVTAVQSIGLTVTDLDNEVRFFTQVLPFKEVARSEAKGRTTDELLNLCNAQVRVVHLALGNESFVLTEHKSKGRRIPADSHSYDHWFQHIAIVVSDMDQAYAHLRKLKVKHVSTGPQTLPEWNPNAGGIKAFYFQDPEDHVLEIIWFPPGKGDPKWQPSRRGDEAEGLDNASASSRGRPQELFLGIDHTAIVVSNTDRSLAFYRDLLGLRVAGESENYGTEQEHLNQVFGARLRITALRSQRGPGIEFLEYITPPGGRPTPPDSQANDLIFWRTELRVDQDVADLAAKLKNSGAAFVSRQAASDSANTRQLGKSVIVRDPDGHALQFTELNSTATASTDRE